MSEAVLDFTPPVELPDPEQDAPPRKVHTCEECGTDLPYNGKGRPPVRCELHKKAGGSSPSGRTRQTGARKTRAEAEAKAIVERLDRGIGKAAVIVAPFDVYDGMALFAMKNPVVEQAEAVLVTHDGWRLWLKDAGEKGSVAGLALAIALGLAPIAAHHGLIPARVGPFPIGEALTMLPSIIIRLSAAAEQGDDVLREYLARMDAKAKETAADKARPAEPKGPSE